MNPIRVAALFELDARVKIARNGRAGKVISRGWRDEQWCYCLHLDNPSSVRDGYVEGIPESELSSEEDAGA